MTFSNK